MDEITQVLEDDDLGFSRTKSRRKKGLQVDTSGEHIFDVALASPASPGPRVRYAYADETDLRYSPVSATSVRDRHVKTCVSTSPHARPTGHYPSKVPGKSMYRVALPAKYRTETYRHYSQRHPGDLERLKKSMIHKNTFFSKKPPLRPNSASTNRNHPTLKLRKTGSFQNLCEDYLGEQFCLDGALLSTSKPHPRREVIRSPTGFPYTEQSSLHRPMSHSERHSLRPATAKLRRQWKVEGRRKGRRPQSATATISGGRWYGGAGEINQQRQFKASTWTPKPRNPQLLTKSLRSVPTSRGSRRVTKILTVNPLTQKEKEDLRRKKKKSVTKPKLPRPQSAGSIHGASFPISTRHPPHFPVRISNHTSWTQKGIPLKT